MLSKPHRKFCEGIVTGLSGVRAYVVAYPRCALNTAAVNASRLRARPEIREEIARMRAQAKEIAGPAVLALAEKRIWLARVVRAQLAMLDLEKDSDLLVSLEFEQRGKNQHVRKLRIADKLAAIKLDHQLSGDDANAPASDPVHESLAALLKRVSDQPWPPPPRAAAPAVPTASETAKTTASQDAATFVGAPPLPGSQITRPAQASGYYPDSSPNVADVSASRPQAAAAAPPPSPTAAATPHAPASAASPPAQTNATFPPRPPQSSSAPDHRSPEPDTSHAARSAASGPPASEFRRETRERDFFALERRALEASAETSGHS